MNTEYGELGYCGKEPRGLMGLFSSELLSVFGCELLSFKFLAEPQVLPDSYPAGRIRSYCILIEDCSDCYEKPFEEHRRLSADCDPSRAKHPQILKP